VEATDLSRRLLLALMASFALLLAVEAVGVEAGYVQVGLVYSDHAPYDSMNVSSSTWRPWSGSLFEPSSIFRYEQRVTVALYNATPCPTVQLVANYSGKPSSARGLEGNVTLSLPYMHDGTRYRLMVSWNFTAYDGRRVDFVVNQTQELTWCSALRRFSPSINTTLPGAWRIKCQVYNVTLTAMSSEGPSVSYARPLGGARFIVLNGTNRDGRRWSDGSAPAVLYNVVAPFSDSPYAGRVSLLIPNTTDVRAPSVNYTLGLRIYWPPGSEVLVYNHTLAANHTRPFSPIPGFTRRIYNITYLSVGHERRWSGIWLNCSVYRADLKVTDRFGNDVEGTSRVEVTGRMLNGTREVAAYTPIGLKGWLNLTYAALCVDEAEGNLNQPSYSGRGSIKAKLIVRWRHRDLGVWYHIYVEESTWSGNLTRQVVAWVNKTRIRLLDRQEPPQPLDAASVSIYFPQAAQPLATVSDAQGYVDLASLLGGSELLPIKHEGMVLEYRMAVAWQGVVVFNQTFRPIDFEAKVGYVEWRASCSVYRLTLHAADSHSRPLQGYSYLTLLDPAGRERSYALFDGSTSDRLPGGHYVVRWCYFKGVSLPPLNLTGFNLDANKAVEVCFPVYDAYLFVTKYFNRSQLIEGVKVYVRFPQPWGVQVAGASSKVRPVVLRQVPKGTLTVYLNATSSTPGFEALTVERPIGWDAVTVADADVNASARSFIYDPIVALWAQPIGMPDEYSNFTYVVVKCNTTYPPRTVILRVEEGFLATLTSNQTVKEVFAGGFAYPLRVYVGGILCLNGTSTLPAPPEELYEVMVELVDVAVQPYNYARSFIVPHLAIKLSWPGLNLSAVDVGSDEAVKQALINHRGYLLNATADKYRPRHVVLYNITLTSGAWGLHLPIPTWRTPYVNGCMISLEAWTIPGGTPGVPEGLEPMKVSGGRWWPREVFNEAWQPLQGFNVTEPCILRILTSAFDFSCSTLDARARPLAGFMVNVSLGGVTLNSTEVGLKPTLRFNSAPHLCYWSNYTYSLSCRPPDPRGLMRHPMTKYAELRATWSYGAVVDLDFKGVVSVEVRDALSRPFEDALVCLINNTGPAVGEIIIYSLEGPSAEAFIPVIAPGGLYDVVVYWLKDGRLNTRFPLGFVDDVVSDSYVVVDARVYDVVLTFISDTGRLLPGLMVEAGYVEAGFYTWRAAALGNGTFLLKQAPVGRYEVRAYWPQGGVLVYEGVEEVWGLLSRTLRCNVYDVQLEFRGRLGTPLKGCKALLTLPGGSKVDSMADEGGRVELINVPRGNLSVSRLEWMGYALEVEPRQAFISASTTYTFRAPGLKKLTVKVVGGLGQGLKATVIVATAESWEAFHTDEGGLLTVEFPPGVYNVTASAWGKDASRPVEVYGDVEEEFRLDVYLVILGKPIGWLDLLLILGVGVALAIALAIVIYEYASKREEMLLRV
jgi:hypothetical protein